MGVEYGYEKFYVAARSGLVNTGTLQQRLESVMIGLGILDRDNFPDEQSYKQFRELIAETTKRPAVGNEGAIRATTSQMTDEEAQKCLHKIVDIFSDIAQAYGRKNLRP